MSAGRDGVKPHVDPFTARAVALVLFAIATGMLAVGGNALASGCIGLMRGRHGPAVLHCAPTTAYWVATSAAFVVGVIGAFAGMCCWRIARQAVMSGGVQR